MSKEQKLIHTSENIKDNVTTFLLICSVENATVLKLHVTNQVKPQV